VTTAPYLAEYRAAFEPKGVNPAPAPVARTVMPNHGARGTTTDARKRHDEAACASPQPG